MIKAVPPKYKWLLDEPGPKMITEALRHYGLLETAGKGITPDFTKWAGELGLTKIYTSDEIAWCGLFIAIVATRSGKQLPFSSKEALWALNWQKFGLKVKAACLGDVLVFRRNGGGHVGLYVGEDATAYHVLGGNQSDTVCITRILKERLYAIRRPLYNVQPDNVRPIKLLASGIISTNEQ